LALEVPPLRDRPEEIGPLADRFLAFANSANGRHVMGISQDAMRVLLRHAWPGNIRELRNAIEHAVVVATGPIIQPEDLSPRTREFAARVLSAAEVTDPGVKGLEQGLREELARYETQLVLDALRVAEGNRADAARMLQIPVRTLAYKIKQLGIRRLGFAADEDSGG
jgi:DNA-binding NtrC family response regulator